MDELRGSMNVEHISISMYIYIDINRKHCENIFKGLDPCKVLRMTSLWCLPPVACSCNVIPSVLQWKHNLMTLTPAIFYHQYHFHAIKMYDRKWWPIVLHLFWPWMSMKWPNGGPLLTTEQYWWPPSWQQNWLGKRIGRIASLKMYCTACCMLCQR